MRATTEVELPWETAPAWPSRCVGCGRADVVATVTVVYDWGGEGLLWPFVRGRKVIAHAPTCRACRDPLQRRLDRRRRAGTVYIVLACLLAAAVVFVLLGTAAGVGIAFLLLMLLLLVPWIVWEVRHPLPLGLSADRDGVTYEFLELSYAREFARANGAELRT
jgi:hypothetical protein